MRLIGPRVCRVHVSFAERWITGSLLGLRCVCAFANYVEQSDELSRAQLENIIIPSIIIIPGDSCSFQFAFVLVLVSNSHMPSVLECFGLIHLSMFPVSSCLTPARLLV